jgi:magnesium transporter
MYISEFIKKSVVTPTGVKIGNLNEVIVSSKSTYPIINAISVKKLDKSMINIPWKYINNMKGEIKLNSELKDIKEYEFKKSDIKLLEDVLDRQVVDIEDKKIRRVNDLKLSHTNGNYHVIGVNIGIDGILRRLGLRRIVRTLGLNLEEDIISWRDIDTLQKDHTKLKLKVPKQSIKKLHPADIAEIVDQLNINDSITVLNSLDEESAADALEEISSERQVSILEEMDTERAADILDEMSPDDAADLIGELPSDKAQELLEKMDPEESKDVLKLLEYPEDTAGGIMTTEFIEVPEDYTVQKILDTLRKMAGEVESIYYIYAKSKDGKLVGATSLRELLLENPNQRLKKFMHKDLITVDVMEDEHEVAKKIAKYNLIAIPVVKENNKIKGVVTVDDAIDIVLPTAWKKRVPRMFGR